MKGILRAIQLLPETQEAQDSALAPIRITSVSRTQTFAAEGLSEIVQVLRWTGIPVLQIQDDSRAKAHPAGQVDNGYKTRVVGRRYVRWTDGTCLLLLVCLTILSRVFSMLILFLPNSVCAATSKYASDSATSHPLFDAMQHLFSTSIPFGSAVFLEAESIKNSSSTSNSTSTPSNPIGSNDRREILLPIGCILPILRAQKVLKLVQPQVYSDVSDQPIPTYLVEDLVNVRAIRFYNLRQFGTRLKTLRDIDEWKDWIPWLFRVAEKRPQDESNVDDFVHGKGEGMEEVVGVKGTKRNVGSIDRNNLQLPTPSPSVESTPEPIPPPLKRVKSSQIVTKVSNLSISSTPDSSRPSSPVPSSTSSNTVKPIPPSPPASTITPPTEPIDEVAAKQVMVDLADAKLAASKSFELETLRHAYSTAKLHGGASFLALDVEFWERDHNVLTEFGWSVVEFVRDEETGKVLERREDQHAVIKENQRFRNGRFAPDARDVSSFSFPFLRDNARKESMINEFMFAPSLVLKHFDFGRTLTLPSSALYYLLHALFQTLSSTHPLFLVFHDPRGDLKALNKLGFDSEKEFHKDLKSLLLQQPQQSSSSKKMQKTSMNPSETTTMTNTKSSMKTSKKSKASVKNEQEEEQTGMVLKKGGGIWIVDTQRIFSGWLGRKHQIGLEKACQEVKVATKRLHNAGNDAHCKSSS